MKKEDKFINVMDYWDVRYPYQFFIGGRGTGKTYSALKAAIEMATDGRINKFIYMRRTETELQAVMDSRLRGETINPFKSVNNDNGWKYGIVPIQKNLGGIYEREFEEGTGKVRITGDQIGYAIALATVSGMRGIDLTDCDYMIYDEFITERHVKKMKAEGEAFLNCIETVSRNRELLGKPPMIVFCLANAFNIHNPIFEELGVIDAVEKMINMRQSDSYSINRGLAIHLLKDRKGFKEEKSKTSLYKLAAGTRFSEMSLENDFIYNDFSLIGYKNIKGMRPCVRIDGVTLWEKKGEGTMYFSFASGNCPRLDCATEHERRYFLRQYGGTIKDLFIKGNVYFETYSIKQKVLELLGVLK